MSKNRTVAEDRLVLGFCSSGNHTRCPKVVSGKVCQCRRCPHDMCADCKRRPITELRDDTNTCVDVEDCDTYMNARRAAKAALIGGTA